MLSVSYLKTFGMWDYHPVTAPLGANNRISKRDCPEVVDPNVHRRYHSIVGCLSYMVNMTLIWHLAILN